MIFFLDNIPVLQIIGYGIFHTHGTDLYLNLDTNQSVRFISAYDIGLCNYQVQMQCVLIKSTMDIAYYPPIMLADVRQAH